MGEVARRQVAAGHAMQCGRGLIQFARQAFGQYLAAGGHRLVLEHGRAAREVVPQRGQRCLTGRVMQ